ncbi:MAG: hypothetical protein A3J55_04525 [Candidatus Ryanbacteria bacterium RIFCSPHIGHO2_02_FULL_45_17b]|uniref:TrbC/VIRB2 family protein n=1 Tax=Candidatus Ryanbacteria bacterium RIFCSPHIGHO2_01_FULL_45_22 TaxID=1802114 RepID=A0A1G2G2X0_9BACT|nr:MAG: hypothetical protein A2719_05100 [Candidatus Ryanbacteria bacterium RIFCSPHIGHO2_01_FULL_45_22]OGZ47609.1 MAG: hypothetical protein A3J55_04525 [Candidatus Ryanbacteria bacterium RIFCSPHIGHO2_02_FULL_45_17b]
MLQKTCIVLISVLMPLFAYAASEDITITAIFNRLSQVLGLVIPLLVLLATVVFMWGILKYITAGGDEKKLEEAKSVIVWGIIALAVMLTAWGFVKIVIDAIFGTQTLPPLPGPDLAPFL